MTPTTKELIGGQVPAEQGDQFVAQFRGYRWPGLVLLGAGLAFLALTGVDRGPRAPGPRAVARRRPVCGSLR